jgi:hypothetical protein
MYEYQLWYVPFRKAAGWRKPELISVHQSSSVAAEIAYELMTDDPSPDRDEYYGYYIKQVKRSE